MIEDCLEKLKTPAFVVDEKLVLKNLELLKQIQVETECEILLALKGFAMFSLFPLISKYLAGVCSSSKYESKLGKEFFKKQVHSYAPAYSEEDINELIKYSDHIVFNSENQFLKYKDKVLGNGIKCGLRINPEFSDIKKDLYNPCARFSRLGIKKSDFVKIDLSGVSGLHFHNHCELNSDSLEKTIDIIEKKFGDYLHEMEWINFGGGHHITRSDYDVEKLKKIILKLKDKYKLKIYLEPGEAVVLNTGFLVASVLDIVYNEKFIAILDTSAAAHMPDVLEMPYRPEIIGSREVDYFNYNYRLGGLTCLAGDIIGEYSFPQKLKIGDKLIFTDMSHYSMVKTTMFNGIQHPSINILKFNGDLENIRNFNYEDYKNRLS